MSPLETMVTDERKWLAGAIDGMSDDEILDFVRVMGGADPLMELVFLLMPQELNPDVAEDGVIGWVINTDDRTFAYQTRIHEGLLIAEAGEPAQPRARLTMSLPAFFRLITELEDAVEAFSDQQVQVEGDLLYAMRLQSMFRHHSPEDANAS
jgi:hypothetical protein